MKAFGNKILVELQNDAPEPIEKKMVVYYIIQKLITK
jgi:hypothetical protein